jgi:hypothetical protein
MMLSSSLKAKSDDQKLQKNETSYVERETNLYCCMGRECEEDTRE